MSSCHSTRQVTDSRRGGSHFTTVPAAPTRPSGMRRMNLPPTFRSISTAWPKKILAGEFRIRERGPHLLGRRRDIGDADGFRHEVRSARVAHRLTSHLNALPLACATALSSAVLAASPPVRGGKASQRDCRNEQEAQWL